MKLKIFKKYLKKLLLWGSLIFIIFLLIVIILFKILNQSKDTPEKKADIIVSLGGGDGARLQKAWQLILLGYSKNNLLLVTGYPDDISKVKYLDPREVYLKEHPEIFFSPVKSKEAKNTKEEIAYIKKYLLTHHYNSVIIVTDSIHSGRVKFLLEKDTEYKKGKLKYMIVSDGKNNILSVYKREKYFFRYLFLEILKIIYYHIIL